MAKRAKISSRVSSRGGTKKTAKSAAKKASAKKTAKPVTAKTRRSASRRTTRRQVKHSVGAGPQSVDRLLQTGGTVTEDLRVVRFAGVSLGGGKTDKTAVAILDYYPDKKRVFLRSLHEKVSSKGEVSADESLFAILTGEENGLFSVAFDVPLQLPTCIRCQLKCPGVDACQQVEIQWMKDVYKKRDKNKRPNKMFTPYTERAAEIYIAHEIEEPFHPSHALGSNAAPLTARAHYLRRRLLTPVLEVYPKLSLWRIGMDLDIPKNYLRFHKHAVDGDEARLYILKSLIEKEIAFIYQQDMRTMVEDNIAFEAFLCALTSFLKYRGQTEKRPAGFPAEESWIEFPVKRIHWF